MTAHRTTPDETGARVAILASYERPGDIIVGSGGTSAFVQAAERVPLARVVAGDEYVVVKRAVIDRVRAHCRFVTEAGAATMYQGGAYDVATEVLTALDGER